MKLVNPKYSQKEEIIKVIGLGGAGSNAVNHMAKKYQSSNVYHICANTDSKHLATLAAVEHHINLGTSGLGAGMRSRVGEQATKESEEEIRNAISGADMLFLAAGMGGGTGTYAISVVAEIAKEMGILTVAVVTKPSKGEGLRKMRTANEGIDRLSKQVNSLIILPNERLVDTLDKDILMDITKAYEVSNDVLANSVNSVTNIISKTGIENVDFTDIKEAMSVSGKAMISSGIAKGENRAIKAINMALSNPLIEEIKLTNAQWILVNMEGNPVGLDERNDVSMAIEDYAHEEAYIKVGFVIDPSMADELKITIILTGLENDSPKLSIDHYPSIIDPSVEVIKPQPQVESLVANRDVPINAHDRDVPAYLRNRQKA